MNAVSKQVILIKSGKLKTGIQIFLIFLMLIPVAPPQFMHGDLRPCKDTNK
jgi:phosphatidylglycerophosphate synthase